MIYVIIGIIVIAADQLTKHLVRGMAEGEVIHVIGDFLRIVHVENSGAAFGILAGSRRFLILFPALIIAGAIYFLSRDLGDDLKGRLSKTALALIASGGIGNMIDRLMYGHVTDMISFSIFPPVFNVADIAVTCGCGLLVFCLICFSSGDDKASAPDGEEKADGGAEAEDEAGNSYAGAEIQAETEKAGASTETGAGAENAGAGESAADIENSREEVSDR